MKKVLVVLMVLVATAAWSGEKEELALKRDLLQERMMRLTLTHKVATELTIPEIVKAWQEAERDLKAVDAELKKLDPPKEEKK